MGRESRGAFLKPILCNIRIDCLDIFQTFPSRGPNIYCSRKHEQKKLRGGIDGGPGGPILDGMEDPMKSYSGKGIFDAKLARERRKAGSQPPRCPAYNFVYDDGSGRIGWQMERDMTICLARAHSTIRSFEGSAEEWLDGKPETIWNVSEVQKLNISEALAHENN